MNRNKIPLPDDANLSYRMSFLEKEVQQNWGKLIAAGLGSGSNKHLGVVLVDLYNIKPEWCVIFKNFKTGEYYQKDYFPINKNPLLDHQLALDEFYLRLRKINNLT